MTIAIVVAAIVSGLFAGACVYVSVVEHPARIEAGPAVGIRHFGPSARRAAVMQGGLAVIGLIASLLAWGLGAGIAWLAGGVLLGAMVPYTLILIKPLNDRMLAATLDTGSPVALELLRRWGRLHAVRTVVGVVVFAVFLCGALCRGACVLAG